MQKETEAKWRAHKNVNLTCWDCSALFLPQKSKNTIALDSGQLFPSIYSEWSCFRTLEAGCVPAPCLTVACSLWGRWLVSTHVWLLKVWRVRRWLRRGGGWGGVGGGGGGGGRWGWGLDMMQAKKNFKIPEFTNSATRGKVQCDVGGRSKWFQHPAIIHRSPSRWQHRHLQWFIFILFFRCHINSWMI